LYHPRRDRWQDHFGIVGAEIVGKTDVGRVTVVVLSMNDEPSMALRSALLTTGEYQPLE
jgi:hypothetical protein